jgi:hypothetical protein
VPPVLPDLVHALPREVAGELVHGKQGRAGVLADCDRVAAMVLMTVRQRHMAHALDRLCEREARIGKGRIEAEEGIDQDARRARVDAEAGMAEPRDLHRPNLRYS